MTDVDSSETEANRETIRAAFARWQDGSGSLAEVFAPEMVWRIEGRSLVAGEYAPAQTFLDEVMNPLAARFVGGEPFAPVRIRSIHADGDAVTVLWDGRGVATDGIPYENAYAWLLRMRDGRVVDGTAFFDSIALDELWTRVVPTPPAA